MGQAKVLDPLFYLCYNSRVMLEESIEISVLFDFYGPLLTEKQQTFVDLYFNENLSLNEIASQFGVTKQAVSDALKKAEKSLRTYEEKLGLVERWKKEIGLKNFGA